VNESTERLRSRSLWAYIFAYGALYGFATFGYTNKNLDGSTDSRTLFLWVGMALVGSTLMALKNRLITDRHLRIRVQLRELAVIAAALALMVVLPSSMGIVRGLILVALFAPYIYWYFKTLDTLQTA
jgi:Ca2+/Na+ antiporter